MEEISSWKVQLVIKQLSKIHTMLEGKHASLQEEGSGMVVGELGSCLISKYLHLDESLPSLLGRF